MKALAIDLGGTFTKAAVVDETGRFLSYEKIKTGGERQAPQIVSDIIDLALNVIKKANTRPEEISHIGMASPGMVNEHTGEIVRINNINLSGINFKAGFSKHFSAPFFISNDANCAALGEYFMLKEKPQSMVMVTIGTGIGGGIIHEGKLFLGINGLCGEIGHMGIVKGGKKCTCGRYGCFEQYASTSALIRMVKERMENNPQSPFWQICGDIEKVDGKTVFLGLDKDFPEAKEIFDGWLEYLSYGILNIINIFQPQLILLGGGIMNEKDRILPKVREYIIKNRYCNYPLDLGITQIDVALGNDAGLIGASLLGRKIL
ncbi:MAG: ROK family protein [Clostridiaceae bacterium]|nr:ROK family protein [Clostridiaceae bacterium]